MNSPVSLQKGLTVWFTGLPCSGKTTLAAEVAEHLRTHTSRIEVLDGDCLRRTLSKDLSFSTADRYQHIRRVAFIAELLAKHGVIVLVSVISPYRELRSEVRRQLGRFVEVYVNAPLPVCEARDVKGMYARARSGELKAFTGVDETYERPDCPEVECFTDKERPSESAAKVLAYLKQQFADTFGDCAGA